MRNYTSTYIVSLVIHTLYSFFGNTYIMLPIYAPSSTTQITQLHTTHSTI